MEVTVPEIKACRMWQVNSQTSVAVRKLRGGETELGSSVVISPLNRWQGSARPVPDLGNMCKLLGL
jgi:hypothetical protein